jgi:hypothetical protein
MQNVVDKFILMSSVKNGTAKYPFDIGKENTSTEDVHLFLILKPGHSS